MKLYEKLAREIEGRIDAGVLLAGERIPSVRQTSQHQKVSISTVLRAYMWLESQGIIESRPQSGYFVRRRAGQPVAAELQSSRPIPVSAEVDVSRLVLSTLRSIRLNDAVPLGSPYPDPSLFSIPRLNHHVHAVARRRPYSSVIDDLPPGNPELIRQIARRYLEHGQSVDPDEIIVTVGATEAINLCLQAVAKPGDTIAVESPTFYAMLHAIERMGMRAIEVATHPRDGIDLAALEKIVGEQRIAACMVMPNFQNPLGFRMSDERKRALVDLLAKHEIPCIENGVYNELYYGDAHPSTLKSFDRKGLVLHCASFSKTLTTAQRIGWAIAGRYRERVEKFKFLNTLATPSIPQIAIAEYLQHDGFDRHLRKLRKAFAQQASIMRSAVERFFPEGTRTTEPLGGYVLWVELAREIDSMTLYQRALDHRITIGPGYMFSARKHAYRNHIRLNYSYAWSKPIEQAVMTIARLLPDAARPPD
ncbi:PLP-dependent aminotransferase family protein [Pararobbsia silviterrae]|uniref:PLP-dependent aminotransferase family protein n=1 Tax=Pararobbsia silviterrae TaxID=1792498 RepID=A0A494Y705_9BURK|nr:PLP-dependent aminotransferase family protein [Pararobbsia silviterrae]RKP55710.1 PLP-dependent aminotransferase family protein [Pararobbsia silviterrae]